MEECMFATCKTLGLFPRTGKHRFKLEMKKAYLLRQILFMHTEDDGGRE